MIYVHYADYPTIRVILHNGWVIINLSAPPDGIAVHFS